MSSRASQPGKTAPRLLHDFFSFDPQRILRNYRVLIDAPPLFEEGGAQPETLQARDRCIHQYSTDWRRSKLPQLDSRPSVGDVYELAVVCTQCRIHASITVEHPFAGDGNVCPTADRPLHHFKNEPSSVPLGYVFRCSSQDCAATLRVLYHPPVITPRDIDLLTSSSALKQRYVRAMKDDPSRSGLKLATPVEALWRLRRYVRDSLKPESGGKKIPANNKRYLEAFGSDCNALFALLGFKYAGENDAAAWYLAQPPAHGERLSPERVLLERWDVELQVLIEQFCDRDKETNPCPEYEWRSARNDLERVLAAQGYEKSIAATRSSDGPAQDHPFYASLGALRDFSDHLILFAYDRQADCDPENAPYYFDCLQDLAKGRQSEVLVIKASTLESQGVVGRKDITEAYKFFDIAPNSFINDDSIISRYHSRLEDTSPSMQPQLRQMMLRLGHVRQSPRLLDAARDTMETYDQALAWLNAEKSYPDDSILTLHTAKIADSPENAEKARKAVSIIAEARNSEPLRSWLTTGELKDSAMDVDEACRHLHIQLDIVEESMLYLVFENARKDNPGQKTDKAIETVTKAFHAGKKLATHSPSTWPTGLISHGNTCYLNSLLQYYFTIKPLRELVLHFDDCKFDITEVHGKVERVGARRVKPFEIIAYQKFVDDLRHLFERMIKDPGNAVKPEADLVCRAFLKAAETEALSVPSTIADRDSKEDTIMTTDSQLPDAAKSQDDKMETTSSRPVSLASSTTIAVSSNGDMPDAMTTSQILPPSPPASRPSSVSGDKPEPLHAPPLPPRNIPTPELQKSNLEKAEEAARQQQDVTEVMDEILFRLRCAIKPLGMDDREEQLDQFRDIFYMRFAEVTSSDGGETVSVTEDASNILLNVPTEPTDIYSALDEVFDLQTIDRAGKSFNQYKTLQTLPPVLQINIPRNTYNRTTGRGVKVEHCVHLEDTLYMDRYVDAPNDPSIMQRRQECWLWRKRLRSLNAEKDILGKTMLDVDGPTAVAAAGDYLGSLKEVNDDIVALTGSPLDIDETVAQDLAQDAEFQRHRLSAIDNRISELKTKISAQFDGLEKMKYRLHAVFFHRGGYGHGHYWTCIHDFHNDMWRVYNDEKVEEFTKLDDIFDAKTWQQGTPTYAVYVLDEAKDQYVEAVCRDPESAAPEPVEETGTVHDEKMEDATAEPVELSAEPVELPTQPEIAKEGEWDSSGAYDPNVKW